MVERINFNKMSGKEISDFLEKEREEKGKYRNITSKKTLERLFDYYKSKLEISEDDKDKKLYLKSTGEKVCNNFDRIVIGVHGAYIEFSKLSKKINLKPKKGQEWRLKKTNPFMKYIWWVSEKDDKIYEQVRTVSYADYKPDKFYIDPNLVYIKK